MTAKQVTVLFAVLLAVIGLWLAISSPPPVTSSKKPAAATLLGILASAADEGYARADRIRPIRLPSDHGPHPGYRTEWWYLTGILKTDGGRPFGYQLTFFRNALSPRPRVSPSKWASNQIYMAHFAISDIRQGRFYSDERFARTGLDLAGARAGPLRVWVENWWLEADKTDPQHWHLSAANEVMAVRLDLEATRPVVLNGDQGLSQKSDEPGNASYYYSLPRIRSAGKIRIGSRTYKVRGNSWLDREWGTSALAAGHSGWDWFGLHLDDGSDLMLYQLRRNDGKPDKYSQGTYTDAGGQSHTLRHDEFDMQVEDTWRSPATGSRYPRRWHIRVPPLQLDFQVSPLVDNQELDLSVRYWEGAVAVRGTRSAGLPLRGSGYMELTGYASGAR